MAHDVLVVGASRGLGAELVKYYAANGTHAFATGRSDKSPSYPPNITYIPHIDIAQQSAGATLAKALSGHKIDIAIITAGYFATESFDEPKWDEEVKMYTTSAIGPIFLVHSLVKEGVLGEGAKVILVSSESGSIALRHGSEGGGNYGHHASKAALNMVGKLLSLDLKGRGVAVGIVHPGFMRTEMTKGVGFDKYWDAGGAVTPNVAADSLIKFIEKFDIKSTGEYWAPRGPGDIGTAEPVLGPKDKLSTPLQLPW